MTRTSACSRLAGAAGCAVIALTGCDPMGLSASASMPSSAPTMRLTEPAQAWALAIVAPGAGDAGVIAAVIRGTARPYESLDVLAAHSAGRSVIGSESPGPVALTVPGRPRPPSRGASAYQVAIYQGHLRKWVAAKASHERNVRRETGAEVRGWLNGLRIDQRLSELPAAAGRQASLGAESAEAASALADLPSRTSLGSRVLVVLFVTSLGGTIPADELNGDDVLVVAGSLPTAAAASAAQISLVRAGADRAAILGRQTPTGQLVGLISAGQMLTARTKIFPGATLFANNSAALLPQARRALSPLIALLRRPGMAAVVNGYASTPGRRRHNYLLSYQRAAAVAGFLESHGVRPSAIIVVGHGASGLVATGASPRNRRVVVVVTGP